MGDSVLIPGARDVRASLDRAETAGADGADAVVVACPPHPQMGGTRRDSRLMAVSDALVERGIDCLRIDYGEWDEGYGESTDVDNAIGWARERYDRVGLFGFSFGGTVALVTAAAWPDLMGVASLAPAARVNADVDAEGTLESISAPVLIVYGTRDSVADWEPVVDRAKELSGGDVDRVIELAEFEADHLFVGRYGRAAERIGEFFGTRLAG
ncbi:putative hydrolase of the alpha/beta superfamily [Halalkaliarchaeum desulfuricum]|uniref:Putative hydrolase of the alpha/beta superfamily n=1 Tax=Halalkaliarchaeum desulfuricum TaxID=2055893 RepID=A0A343TG59_9EURY|nr:dienelactone hydrolase family protein [Halalkaliarchaeum desulfuricum]AUX08081.1 putative hydrolase of the alpha/beta superfamily [Halalkaliarchaeum desulfuricum]